jgi:hypothetical protein
LDQSAEQSIEQLAKDAFAAACEEVPAKRAEEEHQTLAEASRTGNAAAYPHALVILAGQRVRDTLLAGVDAYLGVFARCEVPAAHGAEKFFETSAQQMAGGAHSWVRGLLDLYRARTRRQVTDPGEYINREVQRAKNSALRKAELWLREQRIKAKTPQADAGAASKVGSDAKLVLVPARSLSAISADQDRRAEARKDLKQALLSYTQSLSRTRDIDVSVLAEIWGEYAVRLYDSLAESFIGLPVSREATFGAAGILAGGQTLEEVKMDLTDVRLQRPEHWPPADTSREADDDPETEKVVRELMCSEYRSVGFSKTPGSGTRLVTAYGSVFSNGLIVQPNRIDCRRLVTSGLPLAAFLPKIPITKYGKPSVARSTRQKHDRCPMLLAGHYRANRWIQKEPISLSWASSMPLSKPRSPLSRTPSPRLVARLN